MNNFIEYIEGRRKFLMTDDVLEVIKDSEKHERKPNTAIRCYRGSFHKSMLELDIGDVIDTDIIFLVNEAGNDIALVDITNKIYVEIASLGILGRQLGFEYALDKNKIKEFKFYKADDLILIFHKYAERINKEIAEEVVKAIPKEEIRKELFEQEVKYLIVQKVINDRNCGYTQREARVIKNKMIADDRLCLILCYLTLLDKDKIEYAIRRITNADLKKDLESIFHKNRLIAEVIFDKSTENKDYLKDDIELCKALFIKFAIKNYTSVVADGEKRVEAKVRADQELEYRLDYLYIKDIQSLSYGGKEIYNAKEFEENIDKYIEILKEIEF